MMSENRAVYEVHTAITTRRSRRIVSPEVPTADLLEDFFEARCFLDALNLRRKDALDALITPEIRSKMLTVEAEYEEPITAQVARIAELEAIVKDRVLADGCSTKGTHLHAVWMKGRVTWDGKSLEAYSKADPKLLAFRTEGSPSVVIRGVKE